MISPDKALLLLIDFQERLFPHISGFAEIERAAIRLLRGAQALEVSVVVNEQYKKGLGETIAPLNTLLGGVKRYEKRVFSSLDDKEIHDAIRKSGKRDIILAGIETHICILQTALALKRSGYRPIVVADATGSRNPYDREIALQRMVQAGILPVTVESLLFEMTGSSEHPVFKTISGIIK
ncbi:MAG: hypothetical protein B6D59_03005 [Campylobacteraceae bacterium 4484_4]|nr:MAG: hypothetical protein B6D59_03005 [Campylobacteraceae bacterium 4484_4]